MSEIEYLEKIDRDLQMVFDTATKARDKAQRAIEDILSIKHNLLERKLELLRTDLTETVSNH